MSKTVDERVVEMRFDNKQFESNVQTSMSTIDKLKQKLNFNGASKGLENLNSAANKVNMNGLGSAVETVHAKFSALEVMGVTALANITNSAVNAGKKMVSALTIDPIRTGFSEYETKMNSVQTIMSNTASKGTTMADVTKVLDELNTYADKTIYNFQEMTRNIGTFTAAGVGLEESASAIKGIANLAAASGSSSQQASTAMYQLSQALAAGTVKLMDWNSVVNAGMGGEKFQEALKTTAREHGIAVDEMIKENGSFRDSLQEGWISADILNETLSKFTVEGAKAYSQSMTDAGKWTKEQAEALVLEAQSMEDAATKVKTFTQLWDTLKEAAQSGWAQTWELVIGDFEKAKERLTEISDLLGGLLGDSANRRNNLLEGVLSSKWDILVRKLNTAGIETDAFQDKVKELAKSHNVNLDEMIKKEGSFEKALQSAFKSGKLDKSILSDAIKSFIGDITGATESTGKMAEQMEKYGDIVDKVIRGDFGNGQERIEALTKAGYDYATVQNLVNEKLGVEKRHLSSLSEEQIKNADSLAKMSDEQLKSKKYTDEQIEAIRFLAGEADAAGTSIEELLDDFTKPSGAELIWDSVMTVLNGLVRAIKAVRDAWSEIFSIDKNQLYKVIEQINEFTHTIEFTEEDAGKLKRTLKGLFAILDILRKIAGGALSVAFNILSKILGKFDLNILDVTASVGDAIVGFRDWVFENGFIAKAFDKTIDVIVKVIEKIREWIDIFLEFPAVQNTIEQFKETFSFDNIISTIESMIETVKSWIEAFSDLPIVSDIIDHFKESAEGASDIGSNLIEGIKEGLNDESNTLWDVVKEIGQSILDKIKEVLGIHSPSTEMYDVGKNVVEGLFNGIKDGIGSIGEVCSEVASKIKEVLGSIDWGTVFAGGISIGMLAIINKFANAIEGFSSPLEGLGDFLSNTGVGIKKALTGLSKVFKSFAFSIKAKAIKDIAISLAILVGSIVLLTYVVDNKGNAIWEAIGVLGALAGILAGLVVVVELMAMPSAKFGSETLDFGKLTLALIGISASILILAIAAKRLGSLNADQFKQGLLGLTVIIGLLAGVMAAYGFLVRGRSSENIDKVGKMMLKLSVSLLLMVAAIKLIGKLSPEELSKGSKAIVAFSGVVLLLSLVSLACGKNADKLGSMMIKLSVALILMVAAVKLIGQLSAGELIKGGAAILAFVGVIALLALISKLGGKEATKLGGTLIAMSVSMLLMVGVIKLISQLSPTEIAKGVVAILAFVGIIALLTLIIKMAGNSAPKMAMTLLAMSVSIGILAGVAVLLSMIDLKNLAKGIAAIGMLGLIMAGMIVATRGANDCKGNIIAMTIAIALMAVAIAALSFIDGSKLAGATAALSVVMGMFALMAKAAGSAQKATASLIIMTITVGLIGGMLYLLSSLPIESVLAASASLSLLLLSLSASMFIISKCGTVSPMALLTIGVMTLVVGALGVILYLLRDLPVESTLATAMSLSTLLLAMSAACLILTVVGLGGPAALIGVLSLIALIGGLGALIAGIGALVTEFPQLEEFLNTGIPILEKIGYALGSTIGNMVEGFSNAVMETLPNLGTCLSMFMLNATPFIVGLKSLDASVLENAGALAGAILAITAADLISQIASFITGGSSMEEFGTQLSAFGRAMVSFSNTVSGNIDEDAVMAAANAGKIMADMQSSLYGTGGIIQWFCGEKDMATFGTQLVAFGNAIVRFSSTVSGNVDEEAVTSAANAGKMMADFQSSIYGTGGVIQWFCGEKDMATFGTQLVAFGNAIVRFSNTVGGNIDEDAITAAANAGKIMTDMQSTIVPSGGVVQWFTGEKDMATFGTQLVSFGNAIVNFSNKVKDNIDEDAITAAANAGKIMTEMQSSITPTGGFIDLICGTQDMGWFGQQIVAFGNAMVDFSGTVSGNIDEDAVNAAANAGLIMAELQNAIPSDGGWWSDGTDLDDFGKQIKKYGKKLVDYSDEVADIDSGAVTNSVKASRQVLNFLTTLSGTDLSGDNLDTLKDLLDSLGDKLKDYSGDVSGVDTGAISDSVSSARKIVSLINSMSGLDTSGVGSFKSAVSTLGTVQFDNFAKAFEGSASKMSSVGGSLVDSLSKGVRSKQSTITKTVSTMVNAILKDIKSKYSAFKSAGTELMRNLVNGISSQKSRISSSIRSAVSDGVSSARNYYNNFYNAGSYLVSGFANGISENSYRASAKAEAMAKAAKEAAEEALGINSPSKVFYKIGDYTGQGFVNALNDYGTKTYRAGSEMAEYARNGLSNSIGKISDLISNGIDDQPTIRPVLDLSDVESGAGTISRMFGSGVSIGTSANLNAIGTMMNRRNQNGGSDDVVSAINKLRKELGNVGGNSYNINGVTYDDGSNVADAVKTLVRAANIERRR